MRSSCQRHRRRGSCSSTRLCHERPFDVGGAGCLAAWVNVPDAERSARCGTRPLPRCEKTGPALMKPARLPPVAVRLKGVDGATVSEGLEPAMRTAKSDRIVGRVLARVCPGHSVAA